MLQIARLAPSELGESRDLVAAFFRDRINPDALKVASLLPLAYAGFLRAFGAQPEVIAEARRYLSH